MNGVDRIVKIKAIIMTIVSIISIGSMVLYSQKTQEKVLEQTDWQSDQQTKLENLQHSIAEFETNETEQASYLKQLESEIAELEQLHGQKEIDKTVAEAERSEFQTVFSENETAYQEKKAQVEVLLANQKLEIANASSAKVQLNPELITKAIGIATNQQVTITNSDIKFNESQNVALVNKDNRLFHLLAVGPKVFVINFSNATTIDLVQSIDLQREVVSLEQPVNIIVGEAYVN